MSLIKSDRNLQQAVKLTLMSASTLLCLTLPGNAATQTNVTSNILKGASESTNSAKLETGKFLINQSIQIAFNVCQSGTQVEIPPKGRNYKEAYYCSRDNTVIVILRNDSEITLNRQDNGLFMNDQYSFNIDTGVLEGR